MSCETWQLHISHVDRQSSLASSLGLESVWAACAASEPVDKPLFADGACGVLCIHRGSITLAGQAFGADNSTPDLYAPSSTGSSLPSADATLQVVLTPVTKTALRICLRPGCLLSGFRFKPIVGSLALGLIEQPTLLTVDHAWHPLLVSLYRKPYHFDHGCELVVADLQQRLGEHILTMMTRETVAPTVFDSEVLSSLSDRSVQRYYRRWLNMTPSYFRRVLRVRKTLAVLKAKPDTPLADIAAELGFSDQAHMSRELKAIALLSARQYQTSSALNRSAYSD